MAGLQQQPITGFVAKGSKANRKESEFSRKKNRAIMQLLFTLGCNANTSILIELAIKTEVLIFRIDTALITHYTFHYFLSGAEHFS